MNSSSIGTPARTPVSGQWNSPTEEAILTWTASTDPDLDNYSIRMTPGMTFDEQNNTVVGTVAPGTLEFRTSAGLTNPNDNAAFRIYVVLTDGSEAGSDTVVVSRPIV